MPEPVAGGDISRLREFVPVRAEDRPLILAWLVHGLVSVDTAHTILALLAVRRVGKCWANALANRPIRFVRSYQPAIGLAQEVVDQPGENIGVFNLQPVAGVVNDL